MDLDQDHVGPNAPRDREYKFLVPSCLSAELFASAAGHSSSAMTTAAAAAVAGHGDDEQQMSIPHHQRLSLRPLQLLLIACAPDWRSQTFVLVFLPFLLNNRAATLVMDRLVDVLSHIRRSDARALSQRHGEGCLSAAAVGRSDVFKSWFVRRCACLG